MSARIHLAACWYDDIRLRSLDRWFTNPADAEAYEKECAIAGVRVEWRTAERDKD